MCWLKATSAHIKQPLTPSHGGTPPQLVGIHLELHPSPPKGQHCIQPQEHMHIRSPAVLHKQSTRQAARCENSGL